MSMSTVYDMSFIIGFFSLAFGVMPVIFALALDPDYFDREYREKYMYPVLLATAPFAIVGLGVFGYIRVMHGEPPY